MIEWIIGFLLANWWTARKERKHREQVKEFSGNIDHTFSFGYIREGESIQDLR